MAFWGRTRRAERPSSSPGAGFDALAYERLASRADEALGIARQRGRLAVIASVTVPIRPSLDPLAHVTAARAEAALVWSAFLQPARNDFALATLDEAACVRADQADRFERLAAGCGQTLEAALVDDLFDDPAAPPGAGIVWVGGFSFLDHDPSTDVWRDFPAARLSLPRFSIARRGGSDPQARLTINVSMSPEDSVEREMKRVEDYVERLRLEDDLGPHSFESREGGASVSSVAPPEHFERAVEQAAAEIRREEYEKIVLAREVTLRRERSIETVTALRGLSESFPECTTFAVAQGDTAFLGASPELLIRREGRRASTMALAGSARRGADPETDAHLGAQLMTSHKNREEHDIVVKRIERTLGKYSAWVAAGEKPELIKVKNIQHLATPIRAQLTEPRPVIELAGLLHPTPAVGGEPWGVVRDRIKALEGFDRGWYTGGVGWMDIFEDGEFHVALRSAIIEGPQARLFAGCGIVGESDPAAELAETETKLQALLPVLSES
jgi:salicylate biosynthesis isochorismate synthase/menaquinone-specific isochorismate synthase